MHCDVASMRKACIWREASRIISEEGFRALWKGNLVTIAHRLPYSSISFYAFERYKNVGTTFLLRISYMRTNVCIHELSFYLAVIESDIILLCSYYKLFWGLKMVMKI